MRAYNPTQTSGCEWPIAAQPPLSRSVEAKTWRSTSRRSAQLDNRKKQIDQSFPNDSVLDEVRKHYLLPTDDSVLRYLRDHPSALQVLSEAAPRLKQYFGNSVIVSLRAPIDEGGMRTLYVVVAWSDEVDAVRNALGRFDDEWWLQYSQRTSEYIVFTYELV